MKKLALPVILVLCASALSWCHGGNTTACFYCTEDGCASNVTTVFCNDTSVPFELPIGECTEACPPNTVCQHHGRAFVSMNTPGTCDFEGVGHMPSERCTDHTAVCHFTSGMTQRTTPKSENKNPRSHYILIVAGVGLALVILGLVFIWRRNKGSNQQPQSVTFQDTLQAPYHTVMQPVRMLSTVPP